MFNHDNFVPTDIFKKDESGNDIYFMFGKLSKGYIVTDSNTKSRLIDLEGYKYFFFPMIKNIMALKLNFAAIIPPIMFPVIILSFFIVVVLSFSINLEEQNMWVIIFLISTPIYLCMLLIYLFKISNCLNNCETINSEEKKWVYENHIITVTKSKKNKEDIKLTKSNVYKSEKFKFKKIHVFYILMFIFLSFPFLGFVLVSIFSIE